MAKPAMWLHSLRLKSSLLQKWEFRRSPLAAASKVVTGVHPLLTDTIFNPLHLRTKDAEDVGKKTDDHAQKNAKYCAPGHNFSLASARSDAHMFLAGMQQARYSGTAHDTA